MLYAVYENVTPGSRFEPYDPDDPGEYREVGLFEVDGLDAGPVSLWSVGNKMEPDKTGLDWPRDRRSLSVGDLAVDLDGVVWAVDRVGWTMAYDAGEPRPLPGVR